MLSKRWRELLERSPFQADALFPLCFCTFIAEGYPLDNSKCALHNRSVYRCDQCGCNDYRPSKPKMFPVHWPRCVCGHIAQDHN